MMILWSGLRAMQSPLQSDSCLSEALSTGVPSQHMASPSLELRVPPVDRVDWISGLNLGEKILQGEKNTNSPGNLGTTR